MECCSRGISVSKHFSLCGLCQGGTMLGPPDTVVELGETEVTEEIFMDYLSSLGETTYRSWGRLSSFAVKLFLVQSWLQRQEDKSQTFSLFVCSEATGIVCLSTTATRSPTRWPSSWQAGPSRRTSQTCRQRSSPREWPGSKEARLRRDDNFHKTEASKQFWIMINRPYLFSWNDMAVWGEFCCH